MAWSIWAKSFRALARKSRLKAISGEELGFLLRFSLKWCEFPTKELQMFPTKPFHSNRFFLELPQNHLWLVVDLPLWKTLKSVGVIIPNIYIYGKKKIMFQTTNHIYIYISQFLLLKSHILWKIFQPCSKPATSCILSQQTNPMEPWDPSVVPLTVRTGCRWYWV